jgi:hypothetical protein
MTDKIIISSGNAARIEVRIMSGNGENGVRGSRYSLIDPVEAIMLAQQLMGAAMNCLEHRKELYYTEGWKPRQQMTKKEQEYGPEE